MIKTKRVYEERGPGDGSRVLVDRLWPRGLRREDTRVDEWLKELAPSDELRRWFGHRPERWEEFRQRYIEELSQPEKAEALARLARRSEKEDITLVYAARDTEHNNARVLAELISNRAKGS